ncbi:hypothetical protein [Rhodococcus pyridinivorans]|uniref:Uncharacterized protein n=1 Tax=Rhodococcus pyridinivorans AK37 TaxID=1114960 RepID=H0JV47_9NOCA|nr:hypothetical protein [Rhodococcus pyridinivorans]EHK82143.1 hypothetical protein AK37_17890 [Rhodococcus pyridinivorans AK37]MCD2140406.1 hypothetical protein [Rhodococcus pyridinivorans]
MESSQPRYGVDQARVDLASIDQAAETRPLTQWEISERRFLRKYICLLAPANRS